MQRIPKAAVATLAASVWRGKPGMVGSILRAIGVRVHRTKCGGPVAYLCIDTIGPALDDNAHEVHRFSGRRLLEVDDAFSAAVTSAREWAAQA